MKLTPNDVRAATFQRRMRGFDPDEVEAFQESVAARLEELEQELRTCSGRLAELEREVDQHRDRDQSLRDALIEVRRSGEESRETARREAELMIKEAELKAERILADGEARSRELRQELLRLREQRERFVSRLRHQLTSQLEMLKALTEDLDEAESEGERA